MNDKKTSEDEFVDESFEDEFEFGEDESKTAEPAAPPPFKGGDPRKFIIIGIAVAVIGFIGYFGYQFFTSPSKPETVQAKVKQATLPHPTVNPPIAQTVAPAAPSVPVISGKPQPAAFTEGEVAELLKPKETLPEKQPEKQKELLTTPEPSKTAETNTPEGVLQATVASPPQTQTTPTSLAETLESSLSTAPPTAVEMQNFTQQTQKTLEAFTKLNQQMENNLNQIKYLDAYTREVSLTVEKLNAQISAMDNRVQSLTNLANSLSKDLSKVRNEVGYVKRVIGDEGLDMPPAPTARKQRNVEYPYPAAIEDGIDCNGTMTAPRKKAATRGMGDDLEYVVHAVIPGRAWLKSAKGQIITVTEGEIIGNYGKILVIDASNGVVLTSSGVTFR